MSSVLINYFKMFSPQTCLKKLFILYFSIVFLFIKIINDNKSERLIYTIMFAGGSKLETKHWTTSFFLVLKWRPFQMKMEVWYNRRKYKY